MNDTIKQHSFSEDLIANKRLFTVLNDQLKYNAIFDDELYQELIQYTDEFISFYNLSDKQVIKAYLSYIKSYNKDARVFEETNKYPLEITPDRAEPSRVDYSIILLLSTFLTVHRFRIMQLIKDKTVASEKGLFIGVGPGLEIELVKKKFKEIVAYDLSLDNFLTHYYQEKEIIFRNEFFVGTGGPQYDSIYLIELLEHLSEPYQLLAHCKQVLRPNGKIYLTTATNIPQFDHLYNFEPDHITFNKIVTDLGFKIEYEEDIPHAFITKGIGSKNKFYILGI